MEQTLILVKPDGVKRKLAGEVIGRIEAKNFDIREMKMMTVSRDLAEEHYGEHRDKPFFGGLVEFITSGPIVAMRVEGHGVIKIMRNIMGATNPSEAAPGTIRGDLALTIDENIVHGSDSPESAEREIGLFFG
ncbi:MAG: nucleoside-diphosphate kinase [Actinomycetota bacterium]|jgi:nucleoside-diphosphate kinase|nr:nucleoside-diphosphate kinase [Actinomycetota bacterium]